MLAQRHSSTSLSRLHSPCIYSIHIVTHKSPILHTGIKCDTHSQWLAGKSVRWTAHNNRLNTSHRAQWQIKVYLHAAKAFILATAWQPRLTASTKEVIRMQRGWSGYKECGYTPGSWRTMKMALQFSAVETEKNHKVESMRAKAYILMVKHYNILLNNSRTPEMIILPPRPHWRRGCWYSPAKREKHGLLFGETNLTILTSKFSSLTCYNQEYLKHWDYEL